jgi:hypothetical protein
VDQTGNSQKEPDQDHQDCTDDASPPQSLVGKSFQRCGRQCADGHYRATLRHHPTKVLGVWFELLVSIGPEAFHYNAHCLLLCPFLSSVPKLPPVDPEKRVNITYPADALVLNFF